jgi:hypothetical protein
MTQVHPNGGDDSNRGKLPILLRVRRRRGNPVRELKRPRLGPNVIILFGAAGAILPLIVLILQTYPAFYLGLDCLLITIRLPSTGVLGLAGISASALDYVPDDRGCYVPDSRSVAALCERPLT